LDRRRGRGKIVRGRTDIMGKGYDAAGEVYGLIGNRRLRKKDRQSRGWGIRR